MVPRLGDAGLEQSLSNISMHSSSGMASPRGLVKMEILIQ